MARDDAHRASSLPSPSERPERDGGSKEDDDDDDDDDDDSHSSKRGRERRSRRRRSKHRRHLSSSSEEEEDDDSSESDDERGRRGYRRKRRSRSSQRRSGRSGSESKESSLSDSETELEEERRERRRRRRKEKDRERRRKRKKEKEEKEKRRKDRRRKEKEKKKEKEKRMGKTGAVTDSWGKYGIIRETDMWNKRPEFTAWLAEVKQINLETLSNREEKQMFQEFMEDHNTATFPSKKYYDLEAFHRRQMEKEMKKGLKNIPVERTIFDDEEQRRIEMLKERERQKEAEVEALKRSMQSGLAQAMKEQARLREEMMYQYRLGNFEAAAAIQKRLDPDAPP